MNVCVSVCVCVYVYVCVRERERRERLLPPAPTFAKERRDTIVSDAKRLLKGRKASSTIHLANVIADNLCT